MFDVTSESATYCPFTNSDNDAELLHPDGHLLPGRIIANVGIREGQGIGLLQSANAHPNSPNINTYLDSTRINTDTLHHLCAIRGERKLINE